jgi:hypothetical protein
VRNSPEHTLLFYASLETRNPYVLGEADRLCRGRLDRGRLAGTAEAYGICGGLLSLLSELGRDFPVDPGRMRQAAAREAADTAAMLALYEEVAALFGGGGIPFVPLKGCDIRISGGARRTSNPMDDVDVLVRPEDTGRAGEVLTANGYFHQGSGSGAHMNFAVERDAVRFVEVHWDLVNRESLVQRSLFRPDIGAIWGRTITIGGRAHLSHPDLLCHLAVHAIKEYYRRPKWLADIAWIAMLPERKAGQSSLSETIGEWNASSPLGIAAEALRSLTGEIGYESLFDEGARRSGFAGRFIADRILGYDGLRGMRPLLWIACARTMTERIQVIRGMIGKAVVNG